MNRLSLIRNQLSNTQSTPNPKTDIILIENSNGNNPAIKIVTMNMGLNPLGKELADALYSTLLRLDADEETRVIILTGKGKAFAAGADIKRLSKTEYKNIIKNDWFLSPIINIATMINKPIIAAVNGFAYGGGFELALACDLIIASDKAAFGFPELKLGLFPGAGGTQRLSRLMGYHKAAEYILTTKDIPLAELKSFGVINDYVPADDLIKTCVKLAEFMSKFSTVTVLAAKKALKVSLETTLGTGLMAEKYLFEGLFGTDDKKQGIEAFLNKKTPQFKDK